MYKQLASAVFWDITALNNTPGLEYYVLMVSRAGNTCKIALLLGTSLMGLFLLSEEHFSKVQIPDLLFPYNLWSVQ